MIKASNYTPTSSHAASTCLATSSPYKSNAARTNDALASAKFEVEVK